MELISRTAARAANLKHYWSGQPCGRGHTCGRYASNGSCIDCVLADAAKRQANGARQKYFNAYARQNPEKRRAWEKAKRLKYGETIRAKCRRSSHKFHGLPAATRPKPDACECCGRAETRVRKGVIFSLQLDHCHHGRQFRGWLCTVCNLGIGKLGDTLEAVKRAAAYLERAESEWLHSQDDRSGHFGGATAS
jgi:hypothetical protein